VRWLGVWGCVWGVGVRIGMGSGGWWCGMDRAFGRMGCWFGAYGVGGSCFVSVRTSASLLPDLILSLLVSASFLSIVALRSQREWRWFSLCSCRLLLLKIDNSGRVSPPQAASFWDHLNGGRVSPPQAMCLDSPLFLVLVLRLAR
jgi:hypothetical protein